MITILAGGTGSVKLVRGVASQSRGINVIANVGDNYWLMACMSVLTLIRFFMDLLTFLIPILDGA